MYEIIKHTHSGLRWLVLIALVVAIVNAFSKKDSFSESDKKLSLIALILTHLQLVVGLVLYLISDLVQFSDGTMKNTVLRFFTVEHMVMMLTAIILITIGYSKSKRIDEPAKKFKTIAIFYTIGLVLILTGIPWPFRNLGSGWF